MMSNGFITEATFSKGINGDQVRTDLHIEDLRNGSGGDELIVRIYVAENETTLFFTKSDADALAEALDEIIGRYEVAEGVS